MDLRWRVVVPDEDPVVSCIDGVGAVFNMGAVAQTISPCAAALDEAAADDGGAAAAEKRENPPCRSQ